MIRFATAAIIATSIAATAPVLLAQPASAAPAAAGCTVKAPLPAKIAIAHEHQTLTPKLITTCPGLSYADIYLYGPKGVETIFSYDRPHYDGTWDIYAYAIAPGRYATRAGEAYDSDFNDWGSIAVTSTVVKYAGYDAMSVSRKGSVATFTASASHYDDSFENASGRDVSVGVNVTFQLYTGGRWVSKQTVKSSAGGKAALKVTDTHSRTYRTVVAESGTTFGVTSAGVHS